MVKKIKWVGTLSTTERNNIGLIQVRQNNVNSEVLGFNIVDGNGEPYDLKNRKVLFCTYFDKFAPVEQYAEVIENGKIIYTMNEHDMQKPVRINFAYFKILDDKDNLVDTTQNFSYDIMPSIESKCMDSEPYIIRLEEVLDAFNIVRDESMKEIQQIIINFNEQIIKQQHDFDDWFESIREILESVDPNGILMSEIIESRGGFDDLNQRLNFMEDNNKKKQNSSDLTVTQLVQTINSNFKIVSVENEILKIFTRSPSRDSYVMFELKKGIGDNSNASYGDSFDLLRLTNVHSYKDVIVFNQPKNFTSSQISNPEGDFRLTQFLTGYTYPEKMDYISNTNRESQGGFLEFDIIVDKSNKGIIDLGFYGTPNTNKNLGVYLNDTLIDTVDTSSSEPRTLFKSIFVGSFIGKGKLRLQLAKDATASRALHFLGYNVMDLKYLDSQRDLNGFLANINTGKHYISKTIGANDYAILKTSTNKWFGSFHGGETLVSRKILADSEEIDLSVNKTIGAKKISILQRTNLINLIESQTITDFYNDGTYVFQANFDNKGNSVDVSNMYTCMTCSNNEFNEVFYPRMDTVSPTNNNLILEKTGKVIQYNPNTNQTITTDYMPQLKYFTNIPLRVLYFDNLYSKVYHAQTIDNSIKLENINFGNKKIFD